jgi:hypothetical protein
LSSAQAASLRAIRTQHRAETSLFRPYDPPSSSNAEGVRFEVHSASQRATGVAASTAARTSGGDLRLNRLPAAGLLSCRNDRGVGWCRCGGRGSCCWRWRTGYGKHAVEPRARVIVRSQVRVVCAAVGVGLRVGSRPAGYCTSTQGTEAATRARAHGARAVRSAAGRDEGLRAVEEAVLRTRVEPSSGRRLPCELTSGQNKIAGRDRVGGTRTDSRHHRRRGA